MWKNWPVIALLLGTAAYAVAEDVTLTTYYPSPRGVYSELRVTGNVGVGKATAPGARLEIVGSGNTSATSALLVRSANTTPLLEVEDGGNVGIGTTTPGQKLDVAGNASASIYYDRDNASYYLDPNGTSRLNYGLYDNVNVLGNVTAPIFYDRDNANYYLNPNGTSNVSALFRAQGFNGPEYDINDSGFYLDPNATSALNNLNAAGTISANSLSVVNTVQAQAFFDGGSGYYLDPNGWSYLNSLNVQDIWLRSANRFLSQGSSYLETTAAVMVNYHPNCDAPVTTVAIFGACNAACRRWCSSAQGYAGGSLVEYNWPMVGCQCVR